MFILSAPFTSQLEDSLAECVGTAEEAVNCCHDMNATGGLMSGPVSTLSSRFCLQVLLACQVRRGCSLWERNVFYMFF